MAPAELRSIHTHLTRAPLAALNTPAGSCPGRCTLRAMERRVHLLARPRPERFGGEGGTGTIRSAELAVMSALVIRETLF